LIQDGAGEKEEETAEYEKSKRRRRSLSTPVTTRASNWITALLSPLSF